MSAAAQDDVQAASSAMAAMGVPDSSDARRVARRSQPIVNSGADPSTFDRRIAAAMVAGYEQHDPISSRDRLFQCTVDRPPGAIEVHAVEVENSVGDDGARTQFLVPTAIQSGPGPGRLRSSPLTRRWRIAPHCTGCGSLEFLYG